MANFTTHIAVGTLASGVMATLVMAANVVPPEALFTLAAAGTFGSVLPDIDLKDSRPAMAMFALLGIFLSFVVLFNVGWRYSIAEMWILWIGTYLVVRYPGHALFHRFTIHRGTWHSLLAGAFFAMLTAIVYRHVFDSHEAIAWLAGLFMFLGYVVHLVLDEIYSVDIRDVRVKASFGTALKVYDSRYKLGAVCMAAACLVLYPMTPPIGSFVEAISARDLRAGLQQRLLPKDRWFAPVVDRARMAVGAAPAMDEGANPIKTGSTTSTPREADQPQTGSR
ncbi:MAG: metal-dependent hydrolase [Parvularculaceae bacterium]|nr:metal-dependent hydrolase [Parvularculaceae bacterium]